MKNTKNRAEHEIITMETPLIIRVNRRAVFRSAHDKCATAQDVLKKDAANAKKPEWQVDRWISEHAPGCTESVLSVLEDLRKVVYRDAARGICQQNRRIAAGIYHGWNSKNWKEERHTARGVISLLRAGLGVAPAQFKPDKKRARETGNKTYLSCRSELTFYKTALMLLDGDEWSDACPAPSTVEELLDRFPTMRDDFCFLGESVSSRSEKKPELRFRLGVLLPDFLNDGEVDKLAFTMLAEDLCKTYPFIAKGVAIDISRVAYGNARADAIYQELPGKISHERFSACRARADAKLKTKEERDENDEKRAAAARERRVENAKREGRAVSADGYDEQDPLAAFRETPLRELLEDIGCTENGIETGGAESWHWPDATIQHSFDLFENGGLRIFSNTMQGELPSSAGPKINGHRFLCFYSYGVDFVNASGREMDELLRRLSADGFGCYEKRHKPKPRTGPRRLLSKWEVDPAAGPKIREQDLPAMVEVREDLLSCLKRFVESDVGSARRRFLLVSYDTGTGKSYIWIWETADLLMISPHFELARGNAEESRRALADHDNRAALGLGIEKQHLDREVFLWNGKSAGWRAAAAALGFDPDGEIPTDTKTREAFANRFGEEQGDGRELQCAFADLEKRYHRAGYEFGSVYCPSCAFREECQKKGYLSQRERAKRARHVHVAWSDVVFDGALKTFAGLAETHELAVVDDLPIADMIVKRAVSVAELDVLIKERDEGLLSDTALDLDFKPSGDVLKLLRKLRWLILTDSGPGDVKSALDTFSKTTLQAARRELAMIPFYYSVTGDGILDHKRNRALSKKEFPELYRWLSRREETRAAARVNLFGKMHRVDLTPARAIRLGVVDKHAKLPMLLDKGRGVVNALLDETARVRKVVKPDGVRVLEISVKPNLNFRNTVLLSATADADQVRGMLRPGVEFSHERGPEPRWMSGCAVYQVNTALYTDESFFKRPNAGGEITGPGPRLRDLVNAVLKEVSAERKVLVVGRKALTSDVLKPEMSPLLTNPNVAVLNYGAVDGLNDFSDFDTAFLLLPYPKRAELEERAFAVFREDFDRLDFETRETVQVSGAGYSLSLNLYRDAKVSELAVSLMREQVYQAAMRLRPNLNPEKAIVVLTALPIPGLTDRERLTAFSFQDLRKVREVRELSCLNLPDATVTEDLDGKGVEQIASARGVLESTVRNSKPAREKRAREKSARDDEIRARAAAGETQREIASAMGLSVGGVNKILNAK